MTAADRPSGAEQGAPAGGFTVGATPDRPVGAEQGAPASVTVAAGNLPGQVHPQPRALSPQGGPLGSAVGTHTVRDAVEATFTARVASYVAEAQRQNPQITNPPLAAFHDWVNQPGAGTVNPANAPRYVILVPGTLGPPHRKGDGSYAVTWLVRLQLWLWGRAWRDCDDRLGAYLTATRTCLLQNSSLGGKARSVIWRGETVAPVQQTGGTHTWGQAVLEVAVHVDPVAHAYAGPAPVDATVTPLDPTQITGVGITTTGLPH